MGNRIKAICECGYSTEIFQGAGFESYEIVDNEPAFCKKCRRLIECNYKEENPRCSLCGGEVKFYNESSLQKCPGNYTKKEPNQIKWGKFDLPNVNYLCPQCGEMKLKFSFVGCCD